MLDDLKKIHECDAQDALGIAEKEWQQLEYDFVFSPEVEPRNVLNVVYAGMGGSALAALLVRTWPTLAVPFEVVRDYEAPRYTGSETLFIAASYSGNTEETVAAVAEAEARGAQIAVIAGGGKLADLAREKGYPLTILPKVEQPRFAVFYNLKALVVLLQSAGLLTRDIGELTQTAKFLEAKTKAWLPTVPTKDNPAKQLAQECMGRSVVVYAGPKLFPAAYKWKISFNENAKQVAWAGQYPEFNHNEFIGWSKQPEQKPYTVIDLRSSLEHPRVQRRFEVSEQLLSGMRPSPVVVQAEGETELEQLLWVIMFGDFVTVYAAILNGINPAPVELVEKLKTVLAA
jgi:glucose/mannose-6-phosphate isomerase